jgi:hypothetical protein
VVAGIWGGRGAVVERLKPCLPKAIRNIWPEASVVLPAGRLACSVSGSWGRCRRGKGWVGGLVTSAAGELSARARAKARARARAKAKTRAKARAKAKARAVAALLRYAHNAASKNRERSLRCTALRPSAERNASCGRGFIGRRARAKARAKARTRAVAALLRYAHYAASENRELSLRCTALRPSAERNASCGRGFIGRRAEGRGNRRFLRCVIALRANTPVEMTPRGKNEFKSESNGRGQPRVSPLRDRAAREHSGRNDTERQKRVQKREQRQRATAGFSTA